MLRQANLVIAQLAAPAVTGRRLYAVRATNDTASNAHLWIFDATPGTAAPGANPVVEILKARTGEPVMWGDTLWGPNGYPFASGICAAWSLSGTSFVAPAAGTSLSFSLMTNRGGPA